MAIQYKEYKVLDKDIGELIMLKAVGEDVFPKMMNTIEDIEEMKIKDFMYELDQIVRTGKIIDFINTLSRNKLKKIIKLLILDADELTIYNLHYKNKLTQGEIEKRIGVTRQSINKKLKKINGKIEKVRELFENIEIWDF